MGGFEDVRFDNQIVIDKFCGIAVIREDTANLGSGENDRVRPGCFSKFLDLLLPRQIDLPARGRDDVAIVGLKPAHKSTADHTAMAGNPDFLVGQVVHSDLFPAVLSLPVLDILPHHFSGELANRRLVLPAEFLTCLGRVAKQKIDFRRAEIPRIDFYKARTGRGVIAFSSTPDPFHSKAMPTSAKAHSTNWRTLVVSPVAKT